jgi:hypothetical protein
MKIFGFSLDDLQRSSTATVARAQNPTQRKRKKREEKRRENVEGKASDVKLLKKVVNFDSKLERSNVKTSTSQPPQQKQNSNKWMDSIVGAISEKPTLSKKSDKWIDESREEFVLLENVVTDLFDKAPPPPTPKLPSSSSSSSYKPTTHIKNNDTVPIHNVDDTSRKAFNFYRFIQYFVLILISIYVVRTVMAMISITSSKDNNNDLKMELRAEELKVERQRTFQELLEYVT